MARAIIAMRPEPGLSETLELAKRAGLPVKGVALSRAVPCDWDAPNAQDYDAILAGSANAFRCGGGALANLTSLPVLAVGEKTAESGQQAGFSIAEIGSGGLQGLLDNLPSEKRRLLRLAGKDRVNLDVPSGTTIDSRIVYAMEKMPLSGADAKGLNEGAIVMLFSAVSAEHFRAECERMHIDRGAIGIAALGPRIADAAGSGWRNVHHAEKPNATSLLALVKSLWQM